MALQISVQGDGIFCGCFGINGIFLGRMAKTINFAPIMNKGKKENIIIRAVSVGFMVGLYWRYKLRNKFLALELEETKALNEQLQKIKHETPQSNEGSIVLTGATNSTVTVNIPDLLYIEAIGNYVKVNQFTNGQLQSDMIRATSKQVETDLQSFQNIIRCHRAFLVNLRQIEKIESNAGSLQLIMRHCGESIPVSRSNAAQVKEAVRNGR